MGTLLGVQPPRPHLTDSAFELYVEGVQIRVDSLIKNSDYTADQAIKIVELGMRHAELDQKRFDGDYKDEQASGFAELIQEFIAIYGGKE